MIKNEVFRTYDSKGRKNDLGPKFFKFSFEYENLKQTFAVHAPSLKEAKLILKRNFPTAKKITVVAY